MPSNSNDITIKMVLKLLTYHEPSEKENSTNLSIRSPFFSHLALLVNSTANLCNSKICLLLNGKFKLES